MALLRRIPSLGRRRRMESEIDAELREHIAMCVDDNMALGASRGRVIATMLRSACLMLMSGLAAGTAVTLFATREAATLLFGLKPWDPLTLAGAAALLAVVTVAASLVAALRSANVNPIDSLRAQ